ncbi:MAG: hypothetical protein V2B19_22925 [Pseudomonadota bacterium]
MKITNSEIIKSGERELIDTITGDLDWNTIEQIVRERHKLNIQDDIEYKQGDLIVHDNKVAYRLDFDIKMSLSVVFDRDGNCLSVMTSGDTSQAPVMDANEGSAFESGARIREEGFRAKISTDEITDDIISGESMNSTETKSLLPEMYDSPPDIKPEKNPQENISQMASHIAEMISQINADSSFGKTDS